MEPLGESDSGAAAAGAAAEAADPAEAPLLLEKIELEVSRPPYPDQTDDPTAGEHPILLAGMCSGCGCCGCWCCWCCCPTSGGLWWRWWWCWCWWCCCCWSATTSRVTDGLVGLW